MRYIVLTLWQPWASLLVRGFKTIETRSWGTSFRGPLLVHAAKGLGPGGEDGLLDLIGREPFTSALGDLIRVGDRPNLPLGVRPDFLTTERLPLGAIIGSVRLVACVPTESLSDDGFYSGPRSIETGFVRLWKLTPQEKEFGNHSKRRYAWLCAEARAFTTPIPARGAQRLWTWEGELPV